MIFFKRYDIRATSVIPFLAGGAALIGLYLTSRYSFLLFHGVVEIFSVGVAFGIFMIVWNSRRILDNSYLLVLGIAYLFTGSIDLIHTLAYKGMGVFPEWGANLSVQLWIAARYTESLSLLAAPLVLGRRLSAHLLLGFYSIIFILLMASIFYWKAFPLCFVEGQGLTTFKIASEYIISAILLASIVLLVRKRGMFERKVVWLLVASIVMTICAEMAFTLYVDVYGPANLAGHLLKVISFYFIYRAIIVTGFVNPYGLFFRELKKREDELEKHRDRLEDLVKGRTAEMRTLVRELRREVDDRRQVEEVLRKSEASLADAQRIARLGSWDWNIETNELLWSDEIYGIFGLEPDEFGATYDAFMNSVHPDDREFVQKRVDAAVNGNADYSIDHRIVLPSGEVRHVHELGEVSRDKEGRPIRMLGTVIDITERKRAEEAVKAERERLFAVLEMLPASIHLISQDYSIPFANRQFREEFGDPRGKTCYEILEGRDSPCPECASFNIFKTGGFLMEERARRNGLIYETYFIPFTDSEGARFVLEMAINVTKRKKVEAQKEEAERRLEEQRARAILADRLRSLGQMAAGIAHELNQPLLGVRGLAEHILIALERGWKMSEESVRDKANLIIEQSDRMSHVIEHARMFAKGADHAERIPVQVNEVIRSGIGLIGAQLKSRGIELRTDLAEGLPAVLANPFSLEEVVLNLITNARDAVQDRIDCGPDAAAPVIIIRSFAVDGGTSVNFQVQDNGAGMPHDIMEKVFEPFFTTKGPDTGTGLGLAISRSIVEEFKGSIDIHSETGAGTTVTVALPAMKR